MGMKKAALWRLGLVYSFFILFQVLDTTYVDDQSEDAHSGCTEVEEVAVVPLVYKAQIFCELFHFGMYFYILFILFFCKETHKYL